MRRAIFPVLALLAVALVACGDDEESTPAPTPGGASPTAAATATQAPTEEPTRMPAATATPEPTPDGSAQEDEAVRAALDALAMWLGPVGDPSSITVESVEAVTWSDGCLELGRAGQACTQALVPGFRVELGLGKATYEVRTDASGDNVRWAPKVQILVRFQDAGPNLLEFETDDGGTIVAQAVPGTDFGVDVASLSAGEPVGIALADAPQADHSLLVWVDPVP